MSLASRDSVVAKVFSVVSVRLEVKGTGSLRRPSLYKYFLLLSMLIELNQQSRVTGFAVGKS